MTVADYVAKFRTGSIRQESGTDVLSMTVEDAPLTGDKTIRFDALSGVWLGFLTNKGLGTKR